ncbi:MAG: aromatic amino acid lyase [Candidatus Sericytochromatia bacterium]|nr:aromatic amino acid lyase [Candidatus Sericytochromatia bacterium]
MSLSIGLGAHLTPAALIAGGTDGLAVTPDSWPAVTASADFLAAWVAAGKPCYGVTTGFGPLVAFDVDPTAAGHGLGLIRHLCAGFGPPAPPAIVRAMAISRAHTLAKGYAGISAETLRRWAAFAPEAGQLTVPRYGSVGASGDLIPMAHAVSGWLQRIGLSDLPARDALALVNGTALTTALASAAVATGERLLRWSMRATAEVMAALGCTDAHLQPRIHTLRGHGGQIATAAGIAAGLATLAGPARVRPLQEPYSLRCAPAVLGSLAEALAALTAAAETELNGISDNPIVDVAAEAVWHGGNFHAQHLGARLDLVLGAVVQAANLAERQLALILEPATNGGLPPLLASRPGAQSGFAGAQRAATAPAAQMRASCMPQSSQSLPTNLSNQDLVPFSVGSGWTLWDRLADWARLLATLLLAAGQAAHAHDHPRTTAFTAEHELSLGRFSADQALADPIEALTASLLISG